MKPRIFLGSSGQQEKLLQALTRGLQHIADVDPWTTVFNPGVSTLDRLVDPRDMALPDGSDAAERVALIERRLEEWNSSANS